ncbi:MAG: ATP-dependent DNA helicase RecG [Alphaproteobacteria bacterium]|nr:ATP-dependent DNA helicase RecG [Alphaproteobacteria bacterium]
MTPTPYTDYLLTHLNDLPHYSSFTKKRLISLVGKRVIDLIRHLPTHYSTRTFLAALKASTSKEAVMVTVTIDCHQRGKPYKILAHDEHGDRLEIIYFNARAPYLQKLFPTGEKRAVSGKLEKYFTHHQMIHPDWVGSPAHAQFFGSVEPVYPLTEGLTAPTLRRIIAESLKVKSKLEEWIPPHILDDKQWPSWSEAIYTVHMPGSKLERKKIALCKERLAFDELFAHQIGLLILKSQAQKQALSPLLEPLSFYEQALQHIPFTLTNAQMRTLNEIIQDFKSGHRMIRLLQGDVGSGKTIVAFLAMAALLTAQKQSALLAPTEILARQHYSNLKPLADQIGVRIGLLIGATTLKQKTALKEALAQGEISILIGTHAILEDDVTFKDLGFVIIDEQHRFGVMQRRALFEKGATTHILIMTATPIPRTLVMSAYGDLDVSRLDEKPAHRQFVRTSSVSSNKIQDIINRLKAAINDGEKAYWVCPLIETSDTLDLAAATIRFESLKGILGTQVALIHGQMKAQDRDTIFEQFKNGAIRCLVSTTVIEVGVDVKDATIMIIEHAERFGLAQLHQLRGRVGRGEKHSSCLLIFSHPLSPIAEERLSIMKETNDGFLIAEKDLQLRGSGEVLGTKQSGQITFKNVEIGAHDHLISFAHETAQNILAQQPTPRLSEAYQQLFLLYDKPHLLPQEMTDGKGQAPITA